MLHPHSKAMDLHQALLLLNSTIDEASTQFRRVPGSSILLRYIKNSYQNDPVRSVVELCLFLFAVRYLLAPRYSTKEKSMDLTEEVTLRGGDYGYMILIGSGN
jgi:serine palmitoyltransferase